MQCALAILLFCSCTKVDVLSHPVSKLSQQPGQPAGVQNLGHAFTGSNVTWKIHPHDPNNAALFTKGINESDGYYMLMIDNGLQNSLTPVNALRFVVINLQNFSSKTVMVKRGDGTYSNTSLGRIVKYVFGMDRKFYLATESAYGGGGHLIQYDPNTQTAYDLGKPFRMGSQFLDIYTLNVGTDGALYGGSFGGDGQVMTFRYDYEVLQTSNVPLDNTSRYVTAVSGDGQYTYAVCGKNNWFLYAIDRETGERRTLKSNVGSSTSISMWGHTDAVYAQSGNTYFKLSGFNLASLPNAHRPMAVRVEYVPYATTDSRLPKVAWENGTRKLSYILSNGQSGSFSVGDLYEDVFPTAGPMIARDNQLYFTSAHKGILGSYSPASGFETIGSTSMELHTMTVPYGATADAGKIFLGGYPKGQLLEYQPNNNWTVNLEGVFNGGNGFANLNTNPRLKGLFQNADATGTNGSMILLGSAYTRNGYLVTAGNNDRITSSSGRELSIGSMKNGVIRNLHLPEFANYEFRSISLSADSNSVYLCGLPKSGSTGKIFEYNPASNSITRSWELPLWGDRYATVATLSVSTLAGICDDHIFLFDLNSGTITWKKSIGAAKKMYSMTIAPDKSVYITHMNNSPVNFGVARFAFEKTNTLQPEATMMQVAEFNDADRDERYKPSNMLLANINGTSSIFISGLLSLYQVNL